MYLWRSTRRVAHNSRLLLLALIGVTAAVALGCALASLPAWEVPKVSVSGAAEPSAPIPQSFKSGEEPKLLLSFPSYLSADSFPMPVNYAGQVRANLDLGGQYRDGLREFSPLHRRPPPRSS
jgi:hypothetical protein